jgi:hypothetical protein
MGKAAKKVTLEQRQIYLAKAQYRQCQDIRPCIVVAVMPEADKVKVALLSSALGLYNPQHDFLIPATHPDFAATGLRRTSYVADIEDAFWETTPDNLGKKLGELTGQLATEFDTWLR